MLTVCSKAPADHVGTAAHHRAQRLRAAGEVDDGDVQPLGLEVAALLGNGQRQVVQQVLAAHGQREPGLFGRLGVQQRGAGQHQRRAGGGDKGSASHHLLRKGFRTLLSGRTQENRPWT
jgi:hypothetical protein